MQENLANKIYYPMDFNDINSRLERLYSAVNLRFDRDIAKHIKITKEIDEAGRSIKLSFDKNPNDSLNKILLIIHNLANLKDHLENILTSKGKSEKLIDDEIRNSLELKLVLDLSNAEKHNYPTESRRSKMDPRIENLRHSLMAAGTKEHPKVSFAVNFSSGEYRTEGNCRIIFFADIVDLQGNLIMSLDQLINSSIKKWQEIIEKFDLI